MNIQTALEQYVRENGGEYSVGQTYQSLKWLCDTVPKPTKEQLKICYIAGQKYEQDNAYKIKRRYPPIKEQLEFIYDDIKNNTFDKNGKFYKSIKAVKNEFPKGV